MASIHVEAAPGTVVLRIASSINVAVLELDIEQAVQLASDLLDAAHAGLTADEARPAAAVQG